MTTNSCAIFLLKIVLLIFLLVPPAFAENVKCAECGMMCDLASKFTARITGADGKLYFCDIGDLFSYLKRKKPSAKQVEVKDFDTGAWIDAYKAYYVHSEAKFKTPMGGGIASFKGKKRASEFGAVMDFEGTEKALK